MSNIKLIRVDSRLIHGQVITKWVKQVNANMIVIIDDVLNKDPFMKEIYTMAAPKGVDVLIFDVRDAVNKYKTGEFDNRNVLILFKNLSITASAFDSEFPIKKLQIGGLPGGPGKKNIHKAIFCDEDDLDKIKYLSNNGVDIYLQMVPEDDPIDFKKIKNKL